MPTYEKEFIPFLNIKGGILYESFILTVYENVANKNPHFTWFLFRSNSFANLSHLLYFVCKVHPAV